MARLFADEQFPIAVTNELRALGHDVVTTQQINQSKFGDSKDDELVLSIAMSQERALLTLNRKDFTALHNRLRGHRGIVLCRQEAEFERQAKQINQIIRDHEREHGHLDGQLIDVPPLEPQGKRRSRRRKRG
jgi:hypothetical protein